MKKIIIGLLCLTFIFYSSGCLNKNTGASYKEARGIAKEVENVFGIKFEFTKYPSEEQYDRFTTDI